jgi:hypothetical protein
MIYYTISNNWNFIIIIYKTILLTYIYILHMDPVKEYMIQEQYKRKVYDNYKNTVENMAPTIVYPTPDQGFNVPLYYDIDYRTQPDPDLEDHDDDVSGGFYGSHINNDWAILSIIPPGYKIFPKYLLKGDLDGYANYIHELSTNNNLPFEKTLMRAAGLGLMTHAFRYRNHGGSASKKNLTWSSFKDQASRALKHPSVVVKQTGAYLKDIIPVAVKYAKPIVTTIGKDIIAPETASLSDIGSIYNNFKGYVSEISPIAEKHARELNHKLGGYFPISMARFFKRNPNLPGRIKKEIKLINQVRGGISPNILNDPKFIRLLNEKKNAIEQVEEAIIENYTELEEASKTDNLEVINELAEEGSRLQAAKKIIEDKPILIDGQSTRLVSRPMDIPNVPPPPIVSEALPFTPAIPPGYLPSNPNINFYNYQRPDLRFPKVERNFQYTTGPSYNSVDVELNVNDIVRAQKMTEEIRREQEAKYIEASNRYLKESDNVKNSIQRPCICPDLDPSYEMVKSHIDFIFPSLPEYYRIIMTKNLFKSLKFM